MQTAFEKSCSGSERAIGVRAAQCHKWNFSAAALTHRNASPEAYFRFISFFHNKLFSKRGMNSSSSRFRDVQGIERLKRTSTAASSGYSVKL